MTDDDTVPSGAKVAGDSKLSILLIEDDPGDALLVEEMAIDSAFDYDLVWTKSLGQAQAVLETDRPDCILLDLHLPDAQGLDALAAVQRSANGAPVVVMTGLAEDGTGLAAVAAGAQDYLVKGRVDGDLLTRSVRYAVERKRAENNAAALQASEQRSRENARLERGLLPVPLLRSDHVEVVARYRAGREHGLLGGDFYDVVEAGDGTVHVLIGDICGHGPDEAALGVSLRIAWRTLVVGGVPTDAAMRTLEEILIAERPRRHIFATMTCVVLAPDRSTMRVIRAGHPGMMLRTGSGVHWLEVPGGPALGLRRVPGQWTAHELPIEDRSAMVLFTDGLFESRTGTTERLGEERLLEYARTRVDASADDFVDALIGHAESLAADFGGLTDDIAVVHVRMTKEGARR
ncbi:fused response regulator/phosphatase [Prescottella equi]|uniref:PP2C family protein-serine/threonine phosphatase n=2 Tax=Rhodococcus hoagii TaxID=43767 RepID=UPI000A11BAE7|nr:SpoIIE family protein phosphatase [Prescottella equi]ORL32680.1 fused response regulator/phosphatase [Prescottella equi]ORL90953.1 fused response regulator/phosphatase [Prescottella equi]ORM22841.1 fused response regulator/phosphatase [Prescottella equi]